MLPMRSVWPNKRPRVEFGEISISIDIEIVLFLGERNDRNGEVCRK